MKVLSALFGWLLYGLAAIACALLLFLIALICADVLFRFIDRTGVRWANEVSEYTLYLITFLSAPFLLRSGQHIRVDLVLRVLPAKAAWKLECFIDVSGVAISGMLLISSLRAVAASYTDNALIIKSLTFPEWWLLAPVPFCMLLLGMEFAFRLHRLITGPKQMRDEATSAA